MKPKKSKSLCAGCYNNDYNYGLGGAKECWAYSQAKIIKRLAIPVDLPPPYDKTQADWKMDCYRRSRMAYVKPEVLDANGYWK